jgi:hypothetical protein
MVSQDGGEEAVKFYALSRFISKQFWSKIRIRPCNYATIHRGSRLHTVSTTSLVELGNGMEDSRHILQFLVTFNEAHSLSALVYTKNNFGNQRDITIIWTSYGALTCRRE